jgi:uncharacterized lipoprotein YddW (UPF0748 family)
VRSAILRASLIAAVVLVLAAACSAAPDEVRAFWVDGWGAGFLNQTQVNKLLGVVGDPNQKGDIRNANCNSVIVQVRRRADTAYPSGMGEPYMSGLSPSNFNALQAMINAAHDTTGGKQRIDVHCWLVAFATGGGTVWSQHNNPGDPPNYWPTLDSGGATTADYAFDPGHPNCEEYLTNVCMDMVNNFDIDGIHYDYIRFTGNNQGFNPTSVARFNTIKGRTGQPSSADEVFKQWRRDQVTALVRKVYAKIQSVKPWVKHSGSFVTWNPSPTASTRDAFKATRPYYDVYSDWDSWMEEGIVDMAVPMTYYDWALLPDDYTRWINFEKDRKFNRHMVIGPGIYHNTDMQNAILEILMTRTASPAGNYAQGWSGYSYRVPYTGGTWEAFSPELVAQVTPTTANIPDMPWKSSPTKGHISGTVTYAANGAWADGATVGIAGPDNRTMPCDGTGFYAFIDVTPGSYVVTASKAGYPDAVRNVTVAIGSVTGNMYVTDFSLGGGTPPPAISNVQATGITTTGATITWTTDQAATSQVQYGLTTSYGNLSPLDSTPLTSHSVPLSGLTPGTTYHYRVISGNANGTTTSGDYMFTTVGPPVISNVQATGITNNAATITWTTDQASSSQMEYGLTASYGSLSPLNSTPVTSHSVALSGLTPNTLYHYRVISANGNGSRTSSDYTFTTSGPPTISNVQATGIGATGATITWTTSAPTDGRVNYGATTSYGSQATDPNSNTTSHSVTLTGLTASTQYHYQCVSTNAYGTATSTDYTFTTTQVVVEIIMDNTDPGWSNTSPGGATWSAGSNSLVPKIGTNYLYTAGSGSASSVTRSCRWTPNLSSAGTYDVYVYYQIGTNRNLRAPYIVHYNGGQVTSVQNQWSSTANQGGWFLVGQDLPFLAGSAGYVELTNASTDTNYVSADAAKFVFKAPADTTAPVMASVTDDMYTTSTTTLNGSWSAADPETGIQRYEYAVGTTSGGWQVKGWTSAETATSAAIGGLSLTVGQTYYISARAVNGASLTSTVMSSTGVTVAHSVASIAEAKALDDTDPVALPAASTVSAKFTGYLYVEDSTERASGIRVQSSAAVVLDQTAQVFGRLTVIDGLERALTDCKVVPGAMGTEVQPLVMVTKWLGGGALNAHTPGVSDGFGPNNVGLLVTIVGTVKDKQPGYIYVSDGSNVPDSSGNIEVRVDTTYLADPPEIGKHVVITGISTVYDTGAAHVRMIRVRSDADVTSYD